MKPVVAVVLIATLCLTPRSGSSPARYRDFSVQTGIKPVASGNGPAGVIFGGDAGVPVTLSPIKPETLPPGIKPVASGNGQAGVNLGDDEGVPPRFPTVPPGFKPWVTQSDAAVPVTLSPIKPETLPPHIFGGDAGVLVTLSPIKPQTLSPGIKPVASGNDQAGVNLGDDEGVPPRFPTVPPGFKPWVTQGDAAVPVTLSPIKPETVPPHIFGGDAGVLVTLSPIKPQTLPPGIKPVASGNGQAGVNLGDDEGVPPRFPTVPPGFKPWVTQGDAAVPVTLSPIKPETLPPGIKPVASGNGQAGVHLGDDEGVPPRFPTVPPGFKPWVTQGDAAVPVTLSPIKPETLPPHIFGGDAGVLVTLSPIKPQNLPPGIKPVASGNGQAGVNLGDDEGVPPRFPTVPPGFKPWVTQGDAAVPVTLSPIKPETLPPHIFGGDAGVLVTLSPIKPQTLPPGIKPVASGNGQAGVNLGDDEGVPPRFPTVPPGFKPWVTQGDAAVPVTLSPIKPETLPPGIKPVASGNGQAGVHLGDDEGVPPRFPTVPPGFKPWVTQGDAAVPVTLFPIKPLPPIFSIKSAPEPIEVDAPIVSKPFPLIFSAKSAPKRTN